MKHRFLKVIGNIVHVPGVGARRELLLHQSKTPCIWIPDSARLGLQVEILLSEDNSLSD